MEVNNNNWFPVQGKYYDIDIDLNCRTYEVIELDEKNESAITTIEKIEKILTLKFKPLNLQDPDKILKICKHIYQGLQTEFHSSLAEYGPLNINNVVHDNIFIKLCSAIPFPSFVKRAQPLVEIAKGVHQSLHSAALYSLTNHNKMTKINALNLRIERALCPSISLPALKEINQLILNFLPFKDLNSFCIVNRDAKKHGDINIVQRARQLGIDRKYQDYGIPLSYYYIKDMFNEFDWINRMSKLNEINNFENILNVLNMKAPVLFKLISNEFVFIYAQDAISFIASQKVEVELFDENKEAFSEETVALGEKALFMAYKKKLDLDFLLKRGAVINVNTTDFIENTFLHMASIKDDCQFINVLLSKKPNVNCQNSDYMTPLHLAKSFEFAKLLIESGANVNMIDNWGRTALHFAKTPEIAKLLIESGADVNLNDTKGRTALHYAKTPEMIEFFLGMGLDINQVDDLNQTPLHHAVLYNYGFDCIKLLLEKGVASDQIDFYKCTALDHAKINWRASKDIVRLLEMQKALTTDCIIF